LAIDTPILAAMADELISAAKARPKISFFIVFLLHIWCPAAPIYPESPIARGISPYVVSVPDGVFPRIGTPGSLFETDVPERKNQNT
jgi:hypothetical protein